MLAIVPPWMISSRFYHQSQHVGKGAGANHSHSVLFLDIKLKIDTSGLSCCDSQLSKSAKTQSSPGISDLTFSPKSLWGVSHELRDEKCANSSCRNGAIACYFSWKKRVDCSYSAHLLFGRILREGRSMATWKEHPPTSVLVLTTREMISGPVMRLA